GASSDLPNFASWICFAATLIISNLFRHRGHLIPGVWTYLLGLLIAFSLALWQSGPGPTVYLLMLLPIICSILLVDRGQIVSLALLSCGLMYILTAAQTNFITGLSLVIVPCLFAAVL